MKVDKSDSAELVRRTLEDFLSFAEEIDREIVRPGEATYLQSRVLQLASEALIQKLGEAANRLPEEFRDAHPSVSWRPIRGMRNFVTHRYQQVDHKIIWNAIAHRLPADVAEVSRILDDL